MNKQTLAIIGIIALGSLFSVVYAVGTVITDTGITTPALTVNGNQIGEGSYTSYATVFNGTVSGSDSSFPINVIQVANDGSLVAYDNNNNATIVSTTHVAIGTGHSDSGSNANRVQYGSSSISGEYKFVFNTAGGQFKVFKNNSLLQSFTIDKTQFAFSSMGQVAMGISPDGKFIEVYGPDSVATLNRLLVFQGS